MKKIITLIVLVAGFVGQGSAWNDDVYLISNIDNWDWSKVLNADYANKFTRLSGENDFELVIDRATIPNSANNILYFIIRLNASNSLIDVRPNDSESDYQFTGTYIYTSYGNASGKAFYANLDPTTKKIHIHLHCYQINDNGNNVNRYDVSIAQLKEYTIIWDNSTTNWASVNAYTLDDNLSGHPDIEWLGASPGSSAENIGNSRYKATFYGTSTVKAIFREGSGSSTPNLNLVNYGVYVNTSNSDPTGVIATISDAGIGTFCSSQKVTVPEGVTASYITDIRDKNVLTTTNFTDGIPANTGALIQGNAGTYTFPITNTSPTAASGNKLVCCLNTTAVSQTSGGNNNYILTKKTVNGTVATPMFFLVNSAGNTVTGGHAYLQLPSDLAIAREYFLLWDETESIKNPQLTSDDSQMVYDLQGRRVQQPVKGLYIVDGKKVVK